MFVSGIQWFDTQQKNDKSTFITCKGHLLDASSWLEIHILYEGVGSYRACLECAVLCCVKFNGCLQSSCGEHKMTDKKCVSISC